jgi:hypothetical protein
MSEVKVNKISPRIDCGTTQLGDAGDTITVTGDLKSNSLKSASGSTITLGQSGDTIQLGCGASQTGFGRTGTVDWDTTAKTASFTAVSGNGYFVNTTSGAVTMTLPASPSAGDIVAVADYANTFATNNLTIARNSQPINGGTSDYTSSTNGISLTFVYVDGTRGWKNVNDGTTNATGTPPFIVATGGTITTCGDYKIHTFTGPGTFCVTATTCASLDTVDYVVVAGGGAAGSGAAGGGGGGGFRYYANTTNNPQACAPGSPINNYPSGTAVTVTSQGYPITVGAGGTNDFSPQPPSNDSRAPNSIFATITSTGGGNGGGPIPGSQNQFGNSGGSGGGASGGQFNIAGGTGNTPPVSPSQGNPGGTTSLAPSGGDSRGGGGGGAIASGSPGNPGNRNGGAGAGVKGFGTSGEVCGSVYYFSGGGGGGDGNCNATSTGGIGGGGCSPGTPGAVGVAGTANTGGGGGGSPNIPGVLPASTTGGSGIVIIRYKYQ